MRAKAATGAGPSPLETVSADTVVAVVGGLRLRHRDVEQRLVFIRDEAGGDNLPVPGSPEARRLRRWVVHALVEEAVIESAAVGLGWPTRPRPSVPLADEVVVAVFEAVTATVRIDDATVERYYEHNRERYREPETCVVVRTIRGQLADARRVATVARSHGLANAARSNGEGGSDIVETVELRRGHVGSSLASAVFRARPGDIVGPVASGAGWHVLELMELRAAGTRPLSAVRAEIRRDLLATFRGRRFDAWLAEQRQRSVKLSPGHEHPGDPRVPDSLHRH